MNVKIMCETLVENRPPPETGHDQELSRAPAVAARLARSIAPRLYATPYHVATVAAVTTGSTSPDPRVDNVDPPRPRGSTTSTRPDHRVDKGGFAK